MSHEGTGGHGSADPVPAAPRPAPASELLARALAALEGLADLGETIEDEWTYVAKLAEMGRARIRAAVPDAEALATAEKADAIDGLVAEAGRITDPHRAIDWLSTLPAIVELVLGGRIGDGAPGQDAGAA